MAQITIVRQSPDQWHNIYLIGYMGTGKSSTAVKLGELLDMPVIELDSLIEDYYGKPIKDIFKEIGEDGFRSFETLVLATEIMGCHIPYDFNKGAIFSCGGGVPLIDVNVLAMQNTGNVILLTASPEEILDRISQDDSRPLLEGKMNLEDIREMMEIRRPYYEDAADIVIDTDNKTPGDVAGEIMFALNLVPNIS